MKPIMLVLLLSALSCCGQETSALTAKVSEVEGGKHGTSRFRVETIYRGDTKVMMLLSLANQKGAMVVFSRAYLLGGKLFMVESDLDGNGTFEYVTMLRPDNSSFKSYTHRAIDGNVEFINVPAMDADSVESFTRGADGSVKLVGKRWQDWSDWSKQHLAAIERFKRQEGSDAKDPTEKNRPKPMNQK